MTFGHTTQENKCAELRRLHRNGRLLVLPNVWDVLGAALLQDAGYAAIATASASIAYTNGYLDGEQIPFSALLIRLKTIAAAVHLPVTADIESGYADNDESLRQNMLKIFETGIAGINVEDVNAVNGKMYSVADQCRRIALIRNTAEAAGIPLFINARTDVYFENEAAIPATKKLAETITRGEAYIDAGADCFYPIGVKNDADIRELTKCIKAPINILALQGIPDLKTLEELSISRLSLGPGFLKIAIRAMKQTADKLLNYEGLSEVTENSISSAYLEQLIANK